MAKASSNAAASPAQGTHVHALMEHGGRIDSAEALYPHAPRPWLDLSTGINPCAWEPPADFAVDLRSLPSPAALATLEAVAARHFGTDPARVVALPGTEIGLRLLGALGLPAPARHVGPSYATHEAVFPARISIDSLADEAAHGGTILLANPNNPDGRLVSPDALRPVINALGEHAGWLVVDEAFADTLPDAGLASHLSAEDPVILFRSFGKFFGLAGVRLGFMIAPPGIVERVRDRLGSWPISATALAIGTAAYADRAWIEITRTQLVTRAAALDAVLLRHGLTVKGACPLFRLIVTDDAKSLFEGLNMAGILTRPFTYDPRWLRLGVPADAAALARLDAALAHG